MAKSKTKIVAKSSDKMVLMSRVGMTDGNGGEFMLKAAGGAVFSFVAVGAGLDLSFLPTAEAVGFGGMAAAVAAFIGSVSTYGSAIEKQLSRYTGSSFSRAGKWKTLASILAPVGYSIGMGKKEVAISGELTPNLIGGNYSVYANRDYMYDYYDDYEIRPRKTKNDVTHNVETSLVFKPWGTYIKQEVESSPMGVWDEAFKSTVEVHSFADEKKKVLTSA